MVTPATGTVQEGVLPIAVQTGSQRHRKPLTKKASGMSTPATILMQTGTRDRDLNQIRTQTVMKTYW